MARSMIERRQEAARERLANYDASLRRTSSARRPAPDFEKALQEAKRGFEHLIVREAWAWRPQMKSRNAARLRLAAARYLFARYPVAHALEAIWLDSDGLSVEEIALRKRWFVAAARGESLYKAGANSWLSRKEVHAFLNPPGDLTFAQAFWHAIAAGYTADRSVALRIARTKIVLTPRQDLAFWRDVARFFCVNPTTVEDIDDLCDYLAARHERDRAFTMKGRTIASLRRLMQQWHRDLAEVARIEAVRQRAFGTRGDAGAEAGRWTGSTLADWAWQPAAKERKGPREVFLVTQLVTAADLVAESRAMHHCVSMYAAKCVNGQASIWSLRHRSGGDTDRLLTIELDRQRRTVQIRGFANRLARPEETQILNRWAKARGVILLL